MPPQPDDYVFPEPWHDLRGQGGRDPATRGSLEEELRREVGRRSPFARQPVTALAHFTRQDEVLFQTPSGFVIAHLTWAGRKERYVGVREFADWEAVVAEVEDMAATW